MKTLWNEAYLALNPSQTIDFVLHKSEDDLAKTINLRAVNQVKCQGTANYNNQTRQLHIKAVMEGNIKVEDAVSLELFDYPIMFTWDDEYSFETSETNTNDNLINNPQGFDINEYAIDQIIFQLPINLSLKNDKIKKDLKNLILSDKNYHKAALSNDDDCWNDLRKIIKNKNLTKD